MTSQQPLHIAIIGAGLSGLSLGVALSKILPSSSSTAGPPLTFTIYESRSGSITKSSSDTNDDPVAPSQLDIGGAVMLSPNGLRVLDSLGIYSRIRDQGYNFRTLFFQDATTGAIKESFSFGSSTSYGYDALRVYRQTLIGELLALLTEKGAKVQWGKKFSHIVSEDPHGSSLISPSTSGGSLGGNGGQGKVTFAFTDGTTATATLLVGADGIHSRVRKHMYPDLVPKFTHMAGLTAAVPTSTLGLDLPARDSGSGPYPWENPDILKHPLPLTLTHKKFGAFVVGPQGPKGEEVLIGRQIRLQEDPGKDGLRGIMADKVALIAQLRSGTEDPDLPDIVRNAVREVDGQCYVNLWPFYVVPRLERWVSPGAVDGKGGREKVGRVVILGDSAHAVPPSAGQGVNQAFEDVWTFSLVVQRAVEEALKGRNVVDVATLLGKWQASRQDRVDKILEMNREIDLRRMPEGTMGEGKGQVEGERNAIDVEWLYGVDYEKTVRGWFEEE